ncbi:MAG: FtsQ-type POTRA domain-containing protein [Acutalibacteraceae bacterium]
MSDNGNNKNEKSTGFNWTDEKNAALDRSDSKKYRPTPDYNDSIFSSSPQFGNGEHFGNSDNRFGYAYDFPKDDDYVYSPTSDYTFISQGKQKAKTDSDGLEKYNRTRSKPASGNTNGARRPNGQNGAASKSVRPPEKNSKAVNRQPSGKRSGEKAAGKQPGGQNQKTKSSRPTGQKSSASPTAKKSAAGKPNRIRSGKNQPAAASKPNKRTKLIFDDTAKRIEEEKNRRRREKIEEINRQREEARSQGKSGDDLCIDRSKEQKRNNKFYAAICVISVIAVIAAGFFIFCFAHGFPVSNIVIEGSTIYEESQILQAGSIEKGKNMLKIRQKATNKAISESLPYISHVEVDWQFPDTLRLVVKETDDKLLIVNGSKYICVDKNGKVVSDSKKKVKSGKYKIEGFEEQSYELGKAFAPDADNGNKKRYELVLEIIDAMEDVGITDFIGIDITDFDLIKIRYSKSINIYANADTDFEDRLISVSHFLLNNPISSSGSYYFDIRFENSAVLNNGDLE